jgi:hypothetical protein
MDFAFKGEFFAAEVAFVFLDFGVALADGGVFGFVDEGPELSEGGEVFGVGVAVESESEVEGLLFEEFEGAGAERGAAGGGVLADLDGGFFGVGEIVEECAGEAAFGVAGDGHERNIEVELSAAELDDFAVGDGVIKPGIEAVELVGGEAGEAGERTTGLAGGSGLKIGDWRMKIGICRWTGRR